jgi:hypothetical protein
VCSSDLNSNNDKSNHFINNYNTMENSNKYKTQISDNSDEEKRKLDKLDAMKKKIAEIELKKKNKL